MIEKPDSIGKQEKPKARIRSQLEAHLVVMLKRRAMDEKRRYWRAAERDAEFLRERMESVHTWMDPEAQFMERECQALYNNTLASLPPACRAVFVAVREDGLSYVQTAQRLRTSVKMVAKHMTTAHRVFREALTKFGIDVPREKAGKRAAATKKPAPPAWATRSTHESSGLPPGGRTSTIVGGRPNMKPEAF